MTYAKGWGANKTTREYLDEFEEKRNAKKLSMQQAIIDTLRPPCPKCGSRDIFCLFTKGYAICSKCDNEFEI